MELRHLRYFVAVAEELHFGRAAERLHIVQPALSKQIRGLEEELGVMLLHRTKRQVRLTEAGRAFFEEARHILKDTEQAAEVARRAARGQFGKLAIGFIGPAIYGMLPEILRAYREQYPEVELELHEWTTVEQIKRLRNGSIDAGFVRLPATGEGLTFETVHRDTIMAVLPKDHALADREEIALKAFARDPFILIPRHREPGLYDHYISLCRWAGFSPRVVQEAHRIQTIIGLVAAGIGVSLVPALAKGLRRPGVVYRTLAGQSPALETAIAWRREDTAPVLHNFLDVVREATGKQTNS